MHSLLEARTPRGLRRFIVSGESQEAAEAAFRELLERGERIVDAAGEGFEAREIDPTSIEADRGPVAPLASWLPLFRTDGQRVE